MRASGAPRTSGGLLVLLVVVDLGKLRVDHVLLLGARSGIRTGSGAAWATGPAGTLLGLLVHGFAELHGNLRQRAGLGRDRLGIVALERLLEIGNGVLDRPPLGLADFCAVLGHRLLGRVDERLAVVLGLDLGLAFLVVFGVGLGVLDHPVDVGLGEA